MSVYTRAELEEMSVIQMAAGIDIEMEPIPERAINPFCAKAKERRAYTRRLARAAFQLIPNFALNMKPDAAVAAEEQGTRSVELPPSERREIIEECAKIAEDFAMKPRLHAAEMRPQTVGLAIRDAIRALSSDGRGREKGNTSNSDDGIDPSPPATERTK